MTMRVRHESLRQLPPDEGFVLIAVLWIIAVLATLASIFAIYLANTAVSLSLFDGSIQSEALVSASLELTAYQLTVPKSATSPNPLNPQNSQNPQNSPNSQKPPTHGDFNFRLGRATVAVSFISEAARIDLNSASLQLLANFFAVLGAQPQAAEQYAERIKAWSTRPRAPSAGAVSQDAEDSLYRAAGRSYAPRRAPFAHVDELSLVLDVPPDLIERAKPYLTVYSGKPQVNVLDAAPEVLAAIPGMTPNLLNALTGARTATRDPEAIARMLGTLQEAATVEGSEAFRVQVRIRFDNGRTESSEVVILAGLTDKPYRVLSWRDGFDASSIPIQPGARPR
jgi:general secretion pathway protein K